MEARRVQHAVGHGFFHSGTIEGNALGRFDYVFDCGGENKDTIKAAVARFAAGRDARHLELLAISHFHEDHVGGIEALLEAVHVRIAVLPYLSPEHALLLVAAAVHRKASTQSFIEFVTDSAAWLRSRGNGADVVIVVGDLPADDPGPPGPDLPDAPPLPDISGVLVGSMQIPAGPIPPNLKRIHHRTPVRVIAQRKDWWTFRFFCFKNSDLHKKIVEAARCVLDVGNDVLTNAQECSAYVRRTVKNKNGRELLRKFYEMIVSRRQLNVTSLAMLSGPTSPQFCITHNVSQESWSDRFGCRSRTAWLGMGDVALRRQEILQAFERHFDEHAGQIGTVALSHHGSREDFNGALIDRLSPSVVYATCKSGSRNHPHPDVVETLAAGGRILRRVTKHAPLIERLEILMY